MTPTLQVIASKRQGGAENFFVRLVTELDRGGGVEAAVVRGGAVDRGLAPAVPRHHLPMLGAWDLWSGWRLRRLAARVAVVQTYLGRATRLTRLRGTGIAHVARVGGFYDAGHYAHADLCVTNTRALADHLVRGGIPAERIEVIGNFADPPRAVPEAERAALRRALGIAPETFVIVAVARLHPVKGLDILLDGVARLCARRPGAGVVTVLVGDGPAGDALRRQAGALGLEVRFAGWQRDTAPYLALADVVAGPSRMEGFGGFVLDAWLAGRPVVASRSAGPAELIEDGVTGRLVAVGDAAALAGALAEVMDDPAAAQGMAAAGAVAAGRFGAARIVAEYRALYDRLAGA